MRLVLSALLAWAPIVRAADDAAHPSAPPGDPAGRALGAEIARGRIHVRAFAFEGNRHIRRERLEALVAEFVGRSITAVELEQARRRITHWLVRQGYVNSGALVPDQRVREGVVVIRIVEGRLDEVVVSGQGSMDEDFVAARLRHGIEAPLSLPRLLDRLRLLQNLDAIDRVQSRFDPGASPGGGKLSVRLFEARPLQLGLTLANDRSPSVGETRTQLGVRHRSLTGRGDTLALRYGLGRGSDDWRIDYDGPLNAADLRLSARLEASDARVVEAPFSALDIDSRSRIASLGLSWPIVESDVRTVWLGIGIDRKHSETRLLGQPFSFSPGVQDGRAVATALRLSIDGQRRGARDALAARLSIGRGLDAAGATRADVGPDGRFVTALAQIQWARRIGQSGAQALVRADLQWSRDPLLPTEKLAIGGASTVRGYRENQLVRDRATIVSAELRFPVGESASTRMRDWRAAAFELAPFVDYGRGTNLESATPSPTWIGSAGLALRARIGAWLSAELQYAHRLARVEQVGRAWQDRGIHFRLEIRTP
ncbi:MAG: ShlB/FhaC/HecB family hemolysin secretion/activation protein [Burkholderiaceae bacterium]